MKTLRNISPSILLFMLISCNKMSEKATNHLSKESSPYLLQHAHNPVDWYPWGEEALQKAKDENKPILLSIGYSSCHWCHVMAHESFENEEIAAIMNDCFVNIKLDREERPDIDNVYMDAVQLMGLRGGWPLNVFITHDQKPFYGGTYFPAAQWKRLLLSVADAYKNKHDQLYESAEKFARALRQSEAEKYGLDGSPVKIKLPDIEASVEKIRGKFDREWGGMDKAPKFPMPAIWNFLLTYAGLTGDKAIDAHVAFTLDKIAAGGIYDHIGGGFARYSVDAEWHVPHFEKMLYDNGQLLSLYARAYKKYGKQEYLNVMLGIAGWLERRMLDKEGGFYSALDADSEGAEGKFYVWGYEEIQSMAGKDFSIIAEYYDISPNGNWENGMNVPRKLEFDELLAKELNLSVRELRDIVASFNEKALKHREKRPKPGLDNKVIAGWNGLMLSGLCHAYQATGNSLFKSLASRNARFIKEKLLKNGTIARTCPQGTEGFLEDYAAVIRAFIVYYETFFEEGYLLLAENLTNAALANFFDPKEMLFYYSSGKSEELIARKKEIFDNVIPASNSVMAGNLYKIGIMMDNPKMTGTAGQMVSKVGKLIKTDGEFLSNWANVALQMLAPTAEIIIVGPDAPKLSQEIMKLPIPNKIIMTSKTGSDLPLFEHKATMGGQTTIYVCFDKTCMRPVHTVGEAMAMIKKI